MHFSKSFRLEHFFLLTPFSRNLSARGRHVLVQKRCVPKESNPASKRCKKFAAECCGNFSRVCSRLEQSFTLLAALSLELGYYELLEYTTTAAEKISISTRKK